MNEVRDPRVAIFSGSANDPEAYRHSATHLFNSAGGNLGNFAITHAIQAHLGKSATIVPWISSAEMIRENFDVIVFACANMLGSHTDLGGIAGLLQRIDRPTIALGLGVEAANENEEISLTAGTKRWVDVIASLAGGAGPNIGVRGSYTQDLLDRLGHGDRAAVIGCPSNLINLSPGLGSQIALRHRAGKCDRVAVTAGLPDWPHLVDIERALFRLAVSTGGAYVAQHGLDMVRLCRDEIAGIAPDALELMNKYIAPAMHSEHFLGCIRRYGIAYSGALHWLNSLRKFDFVVGSRFHGVMFGIQAGVPGGVIAHDLRTLEMVKAMSIPHVRYTEFPTSTEASHLTELFPFDAVRYSRTRSELCTSYSDLIRGAGLDPPDGFDGIIDEASLRDAALAAPRL